MLRWVHDIDGMRIHATDGDIGHVHDVYVDDADWRVRYLHVDARPWLGGRHVLLAPSAVRSVDWDGGRIHVALTREQVQTSPDIDSHKPVSRQHETPLSECVHWLLPTPDSLWEGEELAARLHKVLIELRGEDATPSPEPPKDDPHLWSARALRHYLVEGDNGDLGRLGDLLVDPDTWAIRHLVIERGPIHAHRVLVSVNAVHWISWEAKRIRVALGDEGNGETARDIAVGPPALEARSESPPRRALD